AGTSWAGGGSVCWSTATTAMATPRTSRVPSPATRPLACRRSSWRTSARPNAAATWRARTSSTPTPWRRSCAPPWTRAAAPLSSSSRAPTRPPGTGSTLRRAEIYLKAGADGLFIEAPQTIDELTRIGRTFQGVPQLANMLEGGGRTPVLPPSELYRLGFAMVAYPTSLIFRVARAIENALADLKAGRPAGKDESVDFESFKDITSLAHWADVEQRAANSRK